MSFWSRLYPQALYRAFRWRWERLLRLPLDLRADRELHRLARVEKELLTAARRRHEHEYLDQDEPLVSVAIPTYNRGRLLVERTLPSVLEQTYRNIEVVVVGDCCPDDTPELVTKIADPRVRFCNLPERGRYPADPMLRWFVAGSVPHNKALELARGQWLAYLDDDDVMLPDHVESLLRFAQRGGYEIVGGQNECESYAGLWGKGGRWSPSLVRGRRQHLRSAGPSHSAILYRSYLKLFKYDVNAWRYHQGGDNNRFIRMGLAGVRYGFLEKVVARNPLRPGEACRTSRAIATEARLRTDLTRFLQMWG